MNDKDKHKNVNKNEQVNNTENNRSDIFETVCSALPCASIFADFSSVSEPKIITFNNALLKLLGYESREAMLDVIRKRGFLSHMHKDDIENMRYKIDELKAGADTVELTDRAIRSDGSECWVRTVALRFNGSPEQFVVQFVLTDITDKIDEKKNEYLSVLPEIYDEIYEVDADKDTCIIRKSVHSLDLGGKLVSYSSVYKSFIENVVFEDDKKRCEKFFNISSAENKLEKVRTFKYRYYTERKESVKYSVTTVIRVSASVYLLCAKQDLSESPIINENCLDSVLNNGNTQKPDYNYFFKVLSKSHSEIIRINFAEDTYTPIYLNGLKLKQSAHKGLAAALEKNLNLMAPEFSEKYREFVTEEYLKNEIAKGNVPSVTYSIKQNDDKNGKWYTTTVISVESNIYLFCTNDDTLRINAKLIYSEIDSLNENLQKYRRYKLISEHTDLGIIEWNHKNETYYSSKSFNKYAMSDIPESLLRNNKGSLSVVHPEDVETLDSFYNAFKADDGCASVQLRLKMTDGTFRWTEMSAFSVRGDDGTLEYTIGTFRDIDDEKKKMVRLEHTANRAKTIENNISSGIVIYEVADSVYPVYVNDKACEMFGFDRGEYDLRIANKVPVNFVPEKEIMSKAGEALWSGQSVEIKHTKAKRKDGSLFWINSSSTVTQHEDGKIICYSVLQDATKEVEAERIIKERENELKAVVEAMPGGVFKYSADENNDCFEFISENMLKMLGYTKPQFDKKFGNSFSNMVYKMDRKNVLRKINKDVKAYDGFDSCEYRIETKSGALKWVYDVGHLVTDENGNRSYYVVIVDIDDKKEAEKKLLKDKAEIENLINSIPGGVATFEVRPDSFYALFATEGLAAVSGRTLGEYIALLNNEKKTGMYEPDAGYVTEAIKKAMKTGDEVNLIYRVRHINGSLVWVNLRGKRLGNHGGYPLFYAIFHNLSASTELYQSIIDDSDRIMMVIDYNTHEILFCNNAAAAIAHKPKEDAIGKKCYEFIRSGESVCDGCNICSIADGEDCREFDYMGRHYFMRLKRTAWNGHDALISYVADRTELYKAQKLVLKEKKRLETVLGNIPGGVAVFKYEDGKITRPYISDGAIEVLGYRDRSEVPLYVESTYKRVEKEDARHIETDVKAQAISGQTVNFDIHVLPEEGSSRWVNLTAVPSTLPDDGITYYGIYTDITFRKEAELKEKKERQEELERFRREMKYISEAQSDDIVIKCRINLTKGIVEDSKLSANYGESYSGLVFDEAYKQVVNSGVTADQRAEIAAAMAREKLVEDYNNGKKEISLEYQRRIDNGRIIWLKTVIKLYKDPETKDLLAFVYSYNIDDKKTPTEITDRVIDIKCEFLALIDVETANMFIYRNSYIDNELNCSADIINYSEKIGDFIEEYIVPESIEEAKLAMNMDIITARLENSGFYDCTYSVIINDEPGRKHWDYAYLDESKTTIICMRTDITEVFVQQERQQQQLRAALSEAEEAGKAKEDFLANMSHEMRTPMNAIIGITELSRDRSDDKEYIDDALDKISTSSNLLLSQINDVLDMTRIRNKAIVLNPEPYDIEEFEEIIELMVRPLAQMKKIDFSFNHEKVTIRYIMVDKTRINQIFINLLGNAVKYTDEGGKIEFNIIQNNVDDKEADITFIVKDNGIGMSEEFQQHMFEPFKREHAVGTQGTGLGLSIAKSTIDAMGGFVEVESKPGVGTTFTVNMKLALCGGKLSASEAQKTGNGYNVELFEGKNILIVEDNEMNLFIAKSLLQKVGINVSTAVNGAVSVELFENSDEGFFDAILMDVRMPVMNGLEAAKKIRALDRADARNIPIVSLSANAFPEDVKKSLDAGMNAHLAKPINVKNLYRTLSRLIEEE